tara:strand:- start:26 stop:976 length:951 start_codon:yes stop_codon:yes gene_type:complete
MNFLKDSKTPENALLSNSVLNEIMLEKNLKSYSTDLIENPKELFSEVLGIQFNIEKIPWDEWVIYERAMQTDVDIDILRSKLGCIVLPYFLLVEEIKNRNEKLAENALSELSNNIIKLLKRESLIFENGTGYLIERLHLDNALPSSQYNARRRTYSISLFKAFIVNLIEKAPKEKQKDKEEMELKNIEFRKNQEDLDNSEKMKNYKETGFKETNRDRKIREEKEENFKETGIKETDYDRKIREEEEREKLKNKRERKKVKQDKISHAKNMAEEHCKDYKNGVISYEDLKIKLEIMQLKGRLNQDYIDNLLEVSKKD